MHLDNFLACEGSCPNSAPLVHLRGSETQKGPDRHATASPTLHRGSGSRVHLSANCSVSSLSLQKPAREQGRYIQHCISPLLTRGLLHLSAYECTASSRPQHGRHRFCLPTSDRK